jgi:hypothetical protein
VHAYDTVASVSWASSEAIAFLAAAVLARRLVLSEPVPISTPSTVGTKGQHDHRRLIPCTPTFAS